MEEKIPVIIGKACSGKTTLALGLIGDKRYVVIEPSELLHCLAFRQVSEDTEVILLEGVSPTIMKSKTFHSLCHNKKLEVNKQGKKAFSINTPHIIITSQVTRKGLPKSISKSTRYQIIDLVGDPTVDDKSIYMIKNVIVSDEAVLDKQQIMSKIKSLRDRRPKA